MKKVLIIFGLIIIGMFGLSFIDYYIYINNGRFPKLVIKEEYESEEMIVYKGLFYKLYYCKSNNSKIIGSYFDKTTCPQTLSIVDGYYTNKQGISISQKDIYIMQYENIYTLEMIDNMSSEEEVNNAVSVAEKYESSKVKYLSETLNGKNQIYKVVLFQTLTETEDGFKWIYNEKNKYCEIDETKKIYSKVEDGLCSENRISLKMNESWCIEAENSTLGYGEEINKLCK